MERGTITPVASIAEVRLQRPSFACCDAVLVNLATHAQQHSTVRCKGGTPSSSQELPSFGLRFQT